MLPCAALKRSSRKLGCMPCESAQWSHGYGDFSWTKRGQVPKIQPTQSTSTNNSAESTIVTGFFSTVIVHLLKSVWLCYDFPDACSTFALVCPHNKIEKCPLYGLGMFPDSKKYQLGLLNFLIHTFLFTDFICKSYRFEQTSVTPATKSATQ